MDPTDSHMAVRNTSRGQGWTAPLWPADPCTACRTWLRSLQTDGVLISHWAWKKTKARLEVVGLVINRGLQTSLYLQPVSDLG